MKYPSIFVIFLFSLQSFAQIHVKSTEKPITNDQEDKFGISGVFRLYPIVPVHFGNNVFAKAHKTNIGIGGNLAVLRYGDFRTGFSYELNYYEVSDVSKVGNFRTSNNQNFTGFVSYDYKINNKIILVPNVGYGTSYVKQKTSSKRFGNYSGTHFKLGLYTDYEVAKSLAAFIGLHYMYTKYSIDTNPQFENYLENIPQLQFTVGLKIY